MNTPLAYSPLTRIVVGLAGVDLITIGMLIGLFSDMLVRRWRLPEKLEYGFGLVTLSIMALGFSGIIWVLLGLR